MTSYTRSGDVTTPIHAAAENGDVDALLRALESGASPHAIDQNQSTPLQYVCSRPDNDDGRLACLQALIEAGANVNAALDVPFNNRPLMYAAQYSSAKLVAALLESGADVNLGNGDYTPLHWACMTSMRGDLAVERASVLIRNGAAVNQRHPTSGETPLDFAIRYSLDRLFPLLLRAGAALPAQTTNAYLQKVIAAGGFRQYERNHLNALTATFAPKFAHLPPEMVRRVVEYAFHAGDY